MFGKWIAAMALVTSVFAFEGAEQQLVDTVFKAKWCLNEEQCEQVVEKIRLLNGRQDYESVLDRFCLLAAELKPSTTDSSLWDDALDAPIAEPMHRILVETSNVRVLEVIMQPGEKMHLHAHKHAGIIFDLLPSDCTLHVQGEDEILLSANESLFFVHTEGLKPYTSTNVGKETYIGLHFEIKE